MIACILSSKIFRGYWDSCQVKDQWKKAKISVGTTKINGKRQRSVVELQRSMEKGKDQWWNYKDQWKKAKISGGTTKINGGSTKINGGSTKISGGMVKIDGGKGKIN